MPYFMCNSITRANVAFSYKAKGIGYLEGGSSNTAGIIAGRIYSFYFKGIKNIYTARYLVWGK